VSRRKLLALRIDMELILIYISSHTEIIEESFDFGIIFANWITQLYCIVKKVLDRKTDYIYRVDSPLYFENLIVADKSLYQLLGQNRPAKIPACKIAEQYADY
jgi:hypothetical protein